MNEKMKCMKSRSRKHTQRIFNNNLDSTSLREEVKIAVAALKKKKSAAEVIIYQQKLLQAGGRRTGEWPAPWTQSLNITLHKQGEQVQLCQNYRTVGLFSRPSKVMLKVIWNRPKPKTEEIIATEQAGFIAGRSTTELIFNL